MPKEKNNLFEKITNPKDCNVKLTTYFKAKYNKYGYCKFNKISEEQAKVALGVPEEVDNVIIINTVWRFLNYNQITTIVEACTTTKKDEVGNNKRETNMIKFNKLAMENSLIQWDLKDQEGKPYPFNPTNIGKMDPDIVDGLIKDFMERTMVDEEVEKN